MVGGGTADMVDLFTLDKGLEDLMLADYPDKIMPNQHKRDDSDLDGSVYCFYGLNLLQVAAFLKGVNFEYELRNSRNGQIVGI